jgi:hypothetical protein
VVPPVVFNDEPRSRVVKVSSTDESVFDVVEVRLDLGSRQATLHQKPTKAGFHRRFGWRRNRREAT